MDFESLKTQVSNLTLYDLKAGVRKVQNGELDPWQARAGLTVHSGYESYRNGIEGWLHPTLWRVVTNQAQVREATNADPWGAPSMFYRFG